MNNSNKNTALLIFSRTIAEEASVKAFAKGKPVQVNKAVAKALFEKTLKTAIKSGLETIISLSNQQIGANFGERLANEIEKVFDLGYERLIIIGTDCPSLNPAHIVSAAVNLEKGTQAIVGPAADHGAYLIGIHKKHFTKSSFAQLKWQSISLLSNWHQLFPNTFYLEELKDIDSAEDLLSFLKDLHSLRSFRKLIYYLLTIKYERKTITKNSERLSYFISLFFRGPPLMA